MTRRSNGSAASPAMPAAPVKRCAIYCRKSTTAGLEQDFNSLDAQRESCEQYIRSQAGAGWKLIPERYDDGGFSGASLDRPAFQRLMADVEAEKIDIILTYKVDRLSRSLLDFARVMARFNEKGVAFVSVTQNFDTSSAMGRLTLNILMSFSEFEREMIAERTKDKIAASRQKGKWTGGRLPHGYDTVDKRLVVNPLEAVVVRELFTHYLEHRSALATATELNARGRTTKQGQPWSKDAVLRVLRCALVAGYMPLGDHLHEGEHEAIIDRQTFARAQAMLDGNGGPHADHGRNPDYLLRGLLRCGCCGRAYTPASVRKGEKTYRYYRCTTRDDMGRSACPARPLPATAIEGFVIARIGEAAADPSLLADVTVRLGSRTAERRKALETERRELPRAIAKLSTEGKQLMDAVASAAPGSRPLLDGRLDEVGKRLGEHQARLSVVERELAAVAEAEAEAGWVARAIADFPRLWDVMTQANRLRLLRALVHEVVVDDPAGSVTVALADLGAEVRSRTGKNDGEGEEQSA